MFTQIRTDIILWYATFSQAQIVIPLWYAILSVSVIAIWLVFRFTIWIIRFSWMHTSFFLLKHFVYPHVFNRIPLVGVMTRSQTLASTLYITANILCVVLPMTSSADTSRRAATMFLINLMPLICGPRLLLMTQMLGVPLRAHLGFHKWFGRTAIAQILLHMILQIINNRPFQWTAVNLSGVVGGSSLGFISLLSLRLIRHAIYEWFLRSHMLLTIAMLVSLWFHLASKKPVVRIFLKIGLALWSAVTLLHGILFVFRNFSRGKSFATAKVTELPSAIRVTIKVPRPWEVKGGQYIYLTIPAAGITTALQSHPFMIVWWARNGDGLTISLLVKPRHGFTNRLSGLTNRRLTAFIDGPYGPEYNFGDYGTVLMFATGIGIAGHMSYIKDLVRGYNDCDVRTRRIVLIWQLDDEAHQQWVKSWMDEVIKMDTGYILETTLYVLKRSVPGGYESDDVESDLGKADLQYPKADLEYPRTVPYSAHKKLDKTFGSPDIADITKTVLDARKGNVIVSVCSNNIMADEVRRVVQRNMYSGVRLVELDFQPSRKTRSMRSTDMDFHCKGIA